MADLTLDDLERLRRAVAASRAWDEAHPFSSEFSQPHWDMVCAIDDAAERLLDATRSWQRLVSTIRSSRAPLLSEWLQSSDLNPQAVERARQVEKFVKEIKLLTIQVVREEVQALMQEIKGEKNPERVRALGDVLEKLNERYERLEKELIAES